MVIFYIIGLLFVLYNLTIVPFVEESFIAIISILFFYILGTVLSKSVNLYFFSKIDYMYFLFLYLLNLIRFFFTYLRRFLSHLKIFLWIYMFLFDYLARQLLIIHINTMWASALQTVDQKFGYRYLSLMLEENLSDLNKISNTLQYSKVQSTQWEGVMDWNDMWTVYNRLVVVDRGTRQLVSSVKEDISEKLDYNWVNTEE